MNWYLVSPEDESKVETAILPELIKLPFKAYHVRKPKWDAEQLTKWLKQWPDEVLNKMVIHYHAEVAASFPVLGYHLSRAQRKSKRFVKTINQQFLINRWKHLSTGFHHLESLQEFEGELTHAWISPIYESISKTMYFKKWSPFAWDKLKAIKRFKIVALGGITLEKHQDLIDKGFTNAAIKGSIWSSSDPLAAAQKLFQ